jgi:hypothetical protein
MSDRSHSRTAVDDAEIPRTRRLYHISLQLEAVLQSLDLEAEPRLAEEVATAIRATERACEIESEAGDPMANPDTFVFPLR